MSKNRGAIEVDIERCKGCRLCEEACPTGVISMHENVNGKGYNYAYMAEPEKCTGCTNCGVMCPDSVISVYRVKVTA